MRLLMVVRAEALVVHHFVAVVDRLQRAQRVIYSD